MDARTTKRLEAAKGVSLHKGKLRIAFILHGETTQTKRSLGIEATVKNIDFAEMKLAEIKMDILRGSFSWEKHFPNDKQTKKENPTLETALDTFFLSLGHWKGSSERIAVSKAKRLLQAFPKCELRDLTEDVIMRGRKKLMSECSPKHAQALLNILDLVLTRAVRAKVIDTNPFIFIEPLSKTSVKKAEVEDDDVAVFTLEEAERLMVVIPYEASRNMILFLLWTGLRLGEAAALKWDDWNEQQKTITVRRTRTSKSGILQTPKTGKARTIILTLRATQALAAQRELTGANEFVFCSGARLKPFNTCEVVKHEQWGRWLAAAGLPYRKPYATRHTFASWMLMAGESESYVAQTLGHNSVQMIRQVYGHFIPKNSHEWTLDDPQIYEKLKNQT